MIVCLYIKNPIKTEIDFVFSIEELSLYIWISNNVYII